VIGLTRPAWVRGSVRLNRGILARAGDWLSRLTADHGDSVRAAPIGIPPGVALRGTCWGPNRSIRAGLVACTLYDKVLIPRSVYAYDMRLPPKLQLALTGHDTDLAISLTSWADRRRERKYSAMGFLQKIALALALIVGPTIKAVGLEQSTFRFRSQPEFMLLSVHEHA
jgi:hypothetical protein